MKKFIFLLTILITATTFSQQGINYKALIKDANGNVVASQNIDVKFSIIEDAGATVVYAEDHLNKMTDANGIIILNIGEGTPTTNTFASIDWGSETHSLKTEIDIEQDTTFEDLGTTAFNAVPYALSALKSSDNHWKKNGTVVHNTTENIGIGSDTLSAKLGILHDSGIYDPNNGSTSNDNPHILLLEDDNDYARINFGNTAYGDVQWSIQGYIGAYESGRNDRINFWNGHTENHIMTLTGDGRVGIGVGISPKTDFHVGNEKAVLFGTDTLGGGDKLMFLPTRHAFRVGTIGTGASNMYWNNQTYFDDFHQETMNYIGLYSFASGYDTRAQGIGATAMGRDTEATNDYAFASGYFTDADGRYSTAMGYNTDAFGTSSTSLGYHTKAPSFAETAIGSYNTIYTPNDDNSWNANDRLFVVGNGQSGNRSDAFTILKNGATTINSDSHGLIINSGSSGLAYGIQIEGAGGTGVFINSPGDDGIRIDSPVDDGIDIYSPGDNGVEVTSAADNGGFFEGATSGVHAESSNDANPDIILGGTANTGAGDNGIIASDPFYTGSDIFLRSNDYVVVQLDSDNNSNGQFEIKNGSQAVVFEVYESGNATLTGSLSQNSDRRLKKDIEALPYGLKEVLQLQPKAYKWKDRTQDHKSLGLIAQDVQPIIKEIVTAQDDAAKTLGISYTELIPVLINAIKEQQTVIESEKLKVTTLETDVSELKTMVQQLLVKDETALLEKR